jgi:hypothetical protein
MSDGSSQEGSPSVTIAIRGLHDRITRFTDPLVAALRADPALMARVQPTWDQAVQPFFQEWNALWSDATQWTWISLNYFTKRWNSVSDRVASLLPYALRTQLEQASAVGGHVVGDEASVTDAFTRLGHRIQRYNDLVVQAISADPERLQGLSLTWEHEMRPFLREWRMVFEREALWSWATFNDWATRWSEIAAKFTPLLPEAVRSQLLPARVGAVPPRGHYRRL